MSGLITLFGVCLIVYFLYMVAASIPARITRAERRERITRADIEPRIAEAGSITEAVALIQRERRSGR
jgi:hypothetical protein